MIKLLLFRDTIVYQCSTEPLPFIHVNFFFWELQLLSRLAVLFSLEPLCHCRSIAIKIERCKQSGIVGQSIKCLNIRGDKAIRSIYVGIQFTVSLRGQSDMRYVLFIASLQLMSTASLFYVWTPKQCSKIIVKVVRAHLTCLGEYEIIEIW